MGKAYVVLLCLFLCYIIYGIVSKDAFSQKVIGAPLGLSNPDLSMGIVTKEITGQITAVEPSTAKITIKQLLDGANQVYETVNINIDDGTSIIKGLSAVPFDEIQVGDQTTIVYKIEGKKNIAISILIVATDIIKSKVTK